MKKKELAEIRSKVVGEINKILTEKKKELQKVVAQIHTGNEKNLKKARNLRREIAQLLTTIKEKDLMAKNMPNTQEK